MIVNPGIMSSSKCAASEVPRTLASGSVAASCSGCTVALTDPLAASLARATNLKGRPSARAARRVPASSPRIPSRRTSTGFSGAFINTLARAQTLTVASQPSTSLLGSVSVTPNSCAALTPSANVRPVSIASMITFVVELNTPPKPCRRLIETH